MTENIEKISYNQALDELNTIVNQLQNEATDVDALVAMTQRAAKLLTICRERLTTTEEQLRGILESLRNEN